MKFVRLECLVPEQDEEIFTAFMSDIVSWGWETEPAEADQARFIVYLDTDRMAQALLDAIAKAWPQVECALAPFEERDWSESWKEFFVPIRIWNTFVALPPWRTEPEDVDGMIPLFIEPKMAFGTGHHATTFLCLEAVARLWEESAISARTRFLDLGTGSGILGLACAKLGLSGLGLDIDPVAVDNARENARLNRVDELLEIRRGGLEALKDGTRFDLILANILAGPLARMAPALMARLKPGGHLVLSGILADQAPRVEQAYADQGLPPPRLMTRGEWAALVWG